MQGFLQAMDEAAETLETSQAEAEASEVVINTGPVEIVNLPSPETKGAIVAEAKDPEPKTATQANRRHAHMLAFIKCTSPD